MLLPLNLDSLKVVGKSETIFKFDELNKLYLTGWKITTVPNIANSKEFL